MKELPKAYSAGDFEDGIYARWEERGVFNPDCHPEAKPKDPGSRMGSFANAQDDGHQTQYDNTFSIVMPPPNVTGQLHMGHAVMLALEDIMVRFERMRGKKTLWIPGLDHAGIATQNVVEKRLKKEERKTRHDLGREEFLKRVDAFVEQSKATIRNQIKKMGSSCDWSRERYTLEPNLVSAVQKVFVDMYNDGLIYRGDRIVNWCPRCASTLANDEVEYVERKTPFYYFKYGPIVIGTARPETKFFDKTIVVHPDDERYKNLHGKEMNVEWIGGTVKANVIADSVVNPEFGTGAMTITPAHSFEDFELAQKYNLPIVQIIDEQGNFTAAAGEFAGKNAGKSRDEIVEILRKKGLVDHIDEDYTHNLSVCYRCDTPIEPLISKQWFIGVNKKVNRLGGKSLKERAHEAVASGEIEIIPDRFKKTYFHWMDNLRDWCISRQLWFGHRMPVWYRGDEIKVQIESPGKGWTQDPDVLDTWFSAGLWTFTTLGWPKETLDLKTFHPTSVMETGYDILFFWIARMILMTTYNMNEIPFKQIYLHGLVRDRRGRKMSKSHPETCLDPLDMIAKYGADATRLSLFVGTAPGQDMSLYEEKIAGYKKFVNKLWNIARFTFMNAGEVRHIKERPEPKTIADRWILSSFDIIAAKTTKNLASFQFSRAAEDLYEWTWHSFADWYLEIAKFEKEHAYSDNKQDILLYILERLLVLWHPFCPFVTEALYEQFPGEDFLILHTWHKGNEEGDAKTEELFAHVQQVVTQIRNNQEVEDVDPAFQNNIEIQNLITGLTRRSPEVKPL